MPAQIKMTQERGTTLINLAVAALIIAALYVGREIFVPVALAVLLSFVLAPFTDVDMPGSMDGLKLAHAVRGRWPPIKILVVSGQVRLEPYQLPPNGRFVTKPYRTAAMVEELRSLVGSL
jgi:hypothetical protein